MAQVGRAEVVIVADVAQFGRDLERQLQRSVDRLDVDTGRLNAQINRNLRSTADTASRTLSEIPRAARGAFEGTARSAERAGRRIGDAFRDTLRRVRRTFDRLSNALFAFRSRVIGLGAAITIALAGVLAALDELTGLLLPLPALLSMIGAAVATFTVATRGMSDAFEAAFGDAEEFEEALEGLAPAAQSVAREFRTLVPLFERIGIDVQQAFWAQLDGTLTDVAQNLAGPVRSGMAAVATQMGRIAAEIGEFAASTDTARTVARVFSSTAGAMESLVDATQPFLEGMRTLIDIFAPVLGGMGAVIAGLAMDFRDWAEEAERTGSALEAATRAGEFLATLGGIIAGAFRLVEAAVTASRDAGVDLFATIEDLTGAAADLAETPEAQAGMREFFRAIDRLVRALLPLLGQLAVQVGRLATPIADLVEALAPGVAAALEGIADGLIALVESGGREFAEALSDALITLSGALEPVGGALGRVLGALAPLLEPLGQLATILLEVAALIIEALVPFVRVLADVLSLILVPILETWLAVLAEAAPELTQAFVDAAEAMAPFIEQFGLLILQFFRDNLPLVLRITTLIVQGLVGIIEFSIEVWEFWLDVLIRVWEWIKDNIIPIIRDVLWPVIRDELIPALQDLWIEVRDELLPALKDLWLEILKLVDTIVEDADPEVGGFRGLILLVVGAVKFMIDGIRVAIIWIRRIAEALKPVIRFLQRLADALRTVRRRWDTFTDALRTAWRRINDIVNRGLRLTGVLWNVVDAARNAASAISNIPSLPSGLGGIFDFFAQGGIVNRATAAIIGEAGPEVVLPLTRPERARELAMQSGLLDVLLSGASNRTGAGRSALGSGSRGGAPSVVVEAGAVQIRFEGAPDEQTARRVGNAAGEGLLNTLAARNVRLAVKGL